MKVLFKTIAISVITLFCVVSNANADTDSAESGLFDLHTAFGAHYYRELSNLYDLNTVEEDEQILNVPDDYETIQTAINAADNGDEVRVAPGEYVENINFSGKNIVVIGDPEHPENYIIDGDGDGSVVTFENGETNEAVLSGFTIRNGNAYFGGGVFCRDASPTLANLIITDNAAIGDGAAGGGIACERSEASIFSVIVTGNTATSSGGGIYAGDASLSISEVYIGNNQADHTGGGLLMMLCQGGVLDRVIVVSNRSGWQGGGFNLSSSSPQMNNCTIANNNAADNAGGILLYGESRPVFTNTVLWGNEPQQILFRADGGANTATLNYCDIEGGDDIQVPGENQLNWGEGNINADPLFVDADNGDFHLTEDSPCIDIGDPEAELDPDNSRIDMGAYYFHQDLQGLIADPDFLEFDTIFVGQQRELSFTITNFIDENVTVNGIAVEGEGFSVDFIEEFELEPDEQHAVLVTFHPDEEREYNAEVSISSDEIDEDVTVELTGEAQARNIDIVGSIELPTPVYDVSASGRYAFIPGSGIRAIDVSNPEEPDTVGLFSPIGSNLIHVENGFAFVTASNGFNIIDIINPENMEGVSRLEIECGEFVISGSYAYCLNGWGLSIIGISDVANPEVLGTLNFGGEVHGIDVQDEYAYVAAYRRGLLVVDVSDPSEPEIVGNLGTPNIYPISVQVQEQYVYLCSWPRGNWIVDVSDPTDPVQIGNFDDLGTNGKIILHGNYIYYPDYGNGLRVLDISVPDSPKQAAIVNTPNSAYRVDVQGELCFVADGESGLQIIDISELVRDPGYPEIGFEPMFVDFGHQRDIEANDMEIEIINIGYLPLTVMDAQTSSESFSVEFPGEFTLESGASRSLTVTFEPQDIGIFREKLIVSSNDINHAEVEIPLKGSARNTSFIHVPENFATIQAAINASIDGDTILVAPDTYFENINFSGKNILLLGNPDNPAEVIIDGNGEGRVVLFTNGETRDAMMNGFTIRNGSAESGAGLYCSGANPTLLNLIVENNSATNVGGGIYFSDGSQPDLQNLVIRGNNGCGICADGESIVEFENGSVLSNRGVWGGGIVINDGSQLNALNVDFIGNRAYAGGGIYFQDAGGSITGGVIEGNISDGGGGGVLLRISDVDFADVVIRGNSTSYWGGGALFEQGSHATLYRVIITGNHGCALDVASESHVVLEDSEISFTVGYSGALIRTEAEAAFNNCTIINNQTIGIYIDNASEVDLTNTIVWDNQAQIRFNGNGELLNLSYSDIEGGLERVQNLEGNEVNWGDGMIDSDPLFVDPENGDFHLNEDSPCIDTGNPESEPDSDESRADMGAYYFEHDPWPIIYVTPQQILFTGVEPGGTEQDIITISNRGQENLIISEISVPDGPFSTDFDGEFTIEPGSDHDVIIIFEPEQEDVFRATCTVSSNDPRFEETIVSITGVSRSHGIFHVPGEFETIQEVINIVNNGDTIIVADGVYCEMIDFGGKDIVLGSNYILDGDEGHIAETILDGEESGRPVIFSGGESRDAALIGLTIRNGNAENGGGLLCGGASPTLLNLIVENNNATFGGGGMLITAGSEPLLQNITVRQNTSDQGAGGGILVDEESVLDFEGGQIESNSAVHQPNGYGGGICIRGNSRINLSNVDIFGNRGYKGAGFCFLHAAGTITGGVHHSNIANPEATGFWIEDSNPEFSYVIITENSAHVPITINDNSHPIFRFSEISYNSGYGVRIYERSSAEFINCTVFGNGDGIVLINSTEQVTITNSIIRGNNLAQFGFEGNEGSLNVSYSDIEGGLESIQNREEREITWGEGMIDADPLFADPENNDLHLTEDSPCIDTGDPESDPDPDGTRADMGALYFHQLLPEISVEPDILEYETIFVGQQRELALTISNSGDGDLIITDITVEGEVFSVDFAEEFIIEPEEQHEVIITFHPTEEGEYNTELRISSNDLDEQEVSVALSGEALARNVSIVGSLDVPGSVLDVSVFGQNAFIANSDFGIRSIDVSNPEEPDTVGLFPLNSPSNILVENGFAYVAATSGFNIIDVFDPDRMDGISRLEVSGGFDISGNYAYCLGLWGQLSVLDITESTNPELIGFVDLRREVHGIDVQGEFAYIAAYGSGLLVMDISDPTEPTIVGNLGTPNMWPVSVQVRDQYVYLSSWPRGNWVVDVSDPTDPFQIGEFDDLGACGYLTLHGNYLYYSDIGNRLLVIDISVPHRPMLAATVNTPGRALGLDVRGDFAYVADYESGLQIVDISELTSDPGYPEIGFEPSFVDFGHQMDLEANELEIEVFNIGHLPLSVLNAQTRDELFSVEFPGEFELAPGASRSLRVTFNPQENGIFRETLIVSSNDMDQPEFRIPLRASARNEAFINVPGDFETIQAAINAARDGDEINVAPGEYVENIDFIGKNISVIGNPFNPASTVIDGNENGSVVTFENGESEEAILAGFEIRNGSGNSIENINLGGGIFCSESGPIIRDCLIRDNTADVGGGLFIDENSTPTIDKCNVTTNETTGQNSGGGIYIQNSNPTILSTVVNFNHSGNEGGGVFCYNSNPDIINCTLSGNLSENIGGGLSCQAESNPTLINTIIWDNEPPEINIDGISVNYSDIQGGYEGEGNIDEDPLFVDVENGDFHLTENSPCINTGDPDSPEDPDSSRADMGAYYYSPDGDEPRTINVPDDYETIQIAINAARDGDEIIVTPGEYVEQINFSGKNISIIGNPDNPEEIIIDGDHNGSAVIFENGETNDAVLNGITICNGTTAFGGGIYCTGASPTFVNLIIENNYASSSGGGMYFSGGSQPILQNLIIRNNSCYLYGCGICVDEESIVEFEEGNVISNSSGNASGGGIAIINGSQMNALNVDFIGNRSYSGGGVLLVNSSGSLTGGVMEGNICGNVGGGIFVQFSDAELTDVIIRNNRGVTGSGLCSQSGNCTLTRVVITENIAPGGNAGVYFNEASNAVFEFCEISFNSGYSGVEITDECEATFYNSTIVGNQDCGINLINASQADLANTIIWDHTEAQVRFNENGGILNASYSDIQGGLDGIQNREGHEINWGDGMIDADPQFVDPENNDLHISDDSPCIDTGTALIVVGEDTLLYIPRENYRHHAPDMGAYESEFEGVIELGSFETPGIANDIWIKGDLGYIADGESGLRIVDISEVENLTEVGAVDTEGTAYATIVIGNYAYVVDGENGLCVIDVTDPANPELIGEFDTPGEANDVQISANLALVADGENGLLILDISNPAEIMEVGHLDTPGFANGLAVYADFVFVADRTEGVRVIDLRNPAEPEEIGSIDTPDWASQVAVAGDYLYVAVRESGVRVIEIVEPWSPTDVTSFETQSDALDLTKAGDFLFVATSNNGLTILDISDPTEPALAGHFQTPGNALSVDVLGQIAFVADGIGFGVYDCRDVVGEAASGLSIGEEILDFETVFMGEDQDILLNISNDGNSVVNITNSFITGLDADMFEISRGGGIFDIDPEDDQRIEITFAPTSEGAKNALLIIQSDDLLNPQIEIPLTGFGRNPDFVDFIIVPFDYVTIQAAIDAAENGNSILVRPGTYNEIIDFSGKQITIGSLFMVNGDEQYIESTIIDGNGNGSVVTFTDGETEEAILTGFTIRNGSSEEGAGINCLNASPTLEHLIITDNTGYGVSFNGSSATLIQSRISGSSNRGIYCNECNPAISEVIVQGNQDGGIILNMSEAVLNSVEILENTTETQGGGIVLNSSNAVLNNVTVSGNNADNNGGGIILNESHAELTDVVVSNNSSRENGGGIIFILSDAVLTNITISGNNVEGNGAGLFIDRSNPILSNITITGNETWGEGGGIYVESSDEVYSPEMEDVLIYGNVADNGGGMFCYGPSSPVLTRSIIAGNTADSHAGIACDEGANISLTNVTICHNTAERVSGGLFLNDESRATVVNSIFWQNSPCEVYFNWRNNPNFLDISYTDFDGERDGINSNDNGEVIWGEGNFSSDPLFADVENADFHLTWENYPEEDESKSPCIDAGDPESAHDPDGTLADVGAQYFQQNGVREVGYLDTPDLAMDLAFSNNVIYIADGLSGFRIIDVSDPEQPNELGSYNTPGSAQGVATFGDFAIVADAHEYLRIIDVSDSENPDEIGYEGLHTPAYDVVVRDDLAYVAALHGGLYVLDVSDPRQPNREGFINTNGYAYAVAVDGNLAYVANHQSGLCIVDVSDPENLEVVGNFDTPHQAHGIAVDGSIAYIADGNSGLRLIDVSDPENLSELGFIDTPGSANGVSIIDNIAFVADGNSGIRLIDVSDPENPVELGFYDTPGNANDVIVSENLVFVADGDRGLRILDVSELIAELDQYPEIAVSPESFDYGEVQMGESSNQILTISNPGDADLTISDISTDGGGFSVNFDADLIIEPAEEIEVIVTFAPEMLGEVIGTLTIVSNDPNQENLEVVLSGTGIPNNYPPEVVAPFVDFELNEDFEPYILADLNDVFNDPDNDDLTFTANSGNENLIVTLEEDHLIHLRSVENWYGQALVTVTADDHFEEERDVGAYRGVRSINEKEVKLISTSQFVNNSVWAKTIDTELKLPHRDVITEHSFIINVLPVNDSPEIVHAISDFELNEDFEPFVLVHLDTLFFDPDGDELNFLIDSNNENLILNHDHNSDRVSIRATADWFGEAIVTVSANDGVEDGRDEGPSRGVRTINCKETVTESQTTLETTTPSARAVRAVNGNETDNLLPYRDATVEFDFTVTIAPVNDSPFVVDQIDDIVIEQGSDPVVVSDLDDVFADIDDDELNFMISEPPEDLNLIIDENNVLSFHPNEDFSSREGEDVRLIAEDPSGEEAMVMFTVVITPIGPPWEIPEPTDFSHSFTITFVEKFDENGNSEPLTEQAWIGVFGTYDTCIGAVLWHNRVTELSAIGDDPETEEIEGFVPGDAIIFRVMDAHGEYLASMVLEEGSARIFEYDGESELGLYTGHSTLMSTQYFDPVPQEGDIGGLDHNFLINRAEIWEERLSIGDEVGVFTADGLCVGAKVWIGEFDEDWLGEGNMRVGFNCWPDDPQTEEIEGFVAGEIMILSIWDQSTNNVFPVEVEYLDGPDVFALRGMTVVELTAYWPEIQLRENWQMVSVNVINLESENIVDIWENVVERENLITTKDTDGRFYLPAFNFNNIPRWNTEQGYWVKMVDSEEEEEVAHIDSLTMRGSRFVDPELPIPLEEGWSIVAYYPQDDIDAITAFQNITGGEGFAPQENVLIQAKDDRGRFYLPAFFFNNIPPLTPKRGYQVKVSVEVDFIWNTGDVNVASTHPQTEIAFTQHFTKIQFTNNNMSLLILSSIVSNEESELGVFNSGNICIGSCKLSSQEPRGLAIWGDDITTEKVDGAIEDEALLFKLWDGEQECVVYPEFVEGNGIFHRDEIAVIRLTSSGVPFEFNLNSIYPNPFNSSTVISYTVDQSRVVTLKIFDISGREVRKFGGRLHEPGRYTQVLNAQDLATGLYFCKMVDDNQTSVTRKMMLLK